MIRNRFLKFCAAVTFLCGFAHAASAAEMNSPKAGWVVGPIFVKSGTGVNYCSMKNTYQNGQILVFARSGSGADSIGLDFQQPVMEAGRQYAVEMMIGATTRRVTAVAATTQVMIMQMGDDRDFYDAVRRGKSLSFRVGSAGYDFVLTGTSDALEALGNCADALRLGEKFEAVTLSLKKEQDAVTRTSPEPRVHRNVTKRGKIDNPPSLSEMALNDTLQEEIDRLQSENDELEVKNHQTHGILIEQETRKIEERLNRKQDQQQESLKTELDRLRSENKRLALSSRNGQNEIKAELLRLKEENRNLALLDAAGQGESRKQTQAEQDKIKTDLLRLKDENQKLALASAAGHAESQNRALLSQAEREEIKAEILKMKEESRAEILRLKAENQKLTQLSQAKQDEIKAETLRLKEENSKLTLAVQARQEENLKLAMEAQAGQKEIREEILRAREENRKLAEALKSRQDEIGAETARLKEENQQLVQVVQASQEENRRLALMAETHQEENQRGVLDVQSKQEESKKLALEALSRQDEIRAETLRLKEENRKLSAQLMRVEIAGQQPLPNLEETIPEPLPSMARGGQGEMLDIVKQLLLASNVTGGQTVEDVHFADDGAYHWISDDLYGAAQEIAWIPGRTVDEMAGSYIRQAAARCGGSFEQSVGTVKTAGDFVLVEAEMACMDGEDDAAAALLFVSDKNKLGVITQEGTAEQMPVAIEKRNSIVSAASGV